MESRLQNLRKEQETTGKVFLQKKLLLNWFLFTIIIMLDLLVLLF